MAIPPDPFIAASTAVSLTRLLSFLIDGVTEFVNVNENLQMLDIRAQRVQEKLDRLTPALIGKWKPLVRELTTMYYDVDDIIDSVHVAEMRRRRSFLRRFFHPRGRRIVRLPNDDEVSTNITKKARSHMLSKLRRWGMPHKISNMLQKFRDFEEEINHTLEFSISYQQQPNNHNNNNQVLPPGDAVPLTTGRQRDKTSITHMLLQEGDGVSIVGMAGLGKTALARSIVDDESVRNRFQVICWGSAVNGLDRIKFFPLSCADLKVKGSGPIIRALFILDEVIGEDSLSDMMSFESYVSKFFQHQVFSNVTILITTRDPRVAYSTQTTPYYLKRMSDEDCEEMIRMRVCTPNVLPSTHDRDFFDQNVANIAQKSMGLPLLANIIALTLCEQCCRKQNNVRSAITLFATHDLRQLTKPREAILRSLRLGDPNRSSCLNKLLVYFTLFPHQHRFSKSTLLQLWMAEGFIQPENLEQAQECFDDMLPSSMVEPVVNPGEFDNDPSTYQMLEIHGMFAQSFTSNMCHQINTSDRHSFHPIDDTRHLSLCCQIDQNLSPELFDEIANCTRLRTFLLLASNDTEISGVPRSLFQTLLLLRVLDLSRSDTTIVPHSIENLKHLRYLDFSNTPIKKLPESTCKLIGIRVLKLTSCRHLTYLPKKIGNLINLIILDLTGTSFAYVAPNIGKLRKLQILQKFTVMNQKGYQISELRNLNALRSLKIVNLEKVKNAEEAATASLFEKTALTSLELQWTESSMPVSSVAEGVLNKLRPTRNLEELRVTNYSGANYPKWLHFPAPSHHINLQDIYLNHWPFCKELPPFWKFPVLRTLRLDSIHRIQRIDCHFFGDQSNEERFVKLECLEFLNMTELVMWKGLVDGDMPKLRDLKFINCPKLVDMPTLHPLSSLEYLEITDCDQLRENPLLPMSLVTFYFPTRVTQHVP